LVEIRRPGLKPALILLAYAGVETPAYFRIGFSAASQVVP
jgi:hypothetical protein